MINTKRLLAERIAGLPYEKRLGVLRELSAKGMGFASLPIVKHSSGDRVPVSSAQNRMYFLWELDRESAAYHIAADLRIKGKLNQGALQKAFKALVMRHESLRTVFRLNEEGLTEQLVLPEGNFRLEVRTMEGHNAETEIARIHAAPFDLTNGPMLRAVLFEETEEQSILVVVMHHIVSDDWAMNLFVRELIEGYRAAVEGREPQLEALPIQYADYAIWQRDWLEAGERERQLAYWRRQLGSDDPVLDLTTDYARRADGRYREATHSVVLPTDLVDGLRMRLQAKQGTLFMGLLAGVHALLHRYSGQHDIRVGVPIANRHHAGTEGMIGVFMNTQVLKAQLNGQTTFGSLLEQVKEAALGAQAHQDLPFEDLVEALQPERSLSRTPLFQVLFNHLRVGDDARFAQLPDLSVESVGEGAQQPSKFDLTLTTTETVDGRVRVSFSYAWELFDAATIERMARHYVSVLRALTEHPEQTVGSVLLLDEADYAQVMTWGANAERYPDVALVHQLVEAQALARPQDTALEFGEEELSYAELNDRANRLAHHLIKLGVGPEVRVGVALERSVELVVSLMAILKAGGGYVPLDPGYPAERLAYMAEDSGIGLLVTHSELSTKIPLAADVRGVQIDDLDLTSGTVTNPNVTVHGENLAYVIYTSGSTGKPKGTQLSHRNVSRLLAATEPWFHFGPTDVWTLFHSYAFDFSVWEMFGALSTGGKLVVVPYWVSRSPDSFLALLREQQVTVLNQTPSAFGQLIHAVEQDAEGGEGLALRWVIFGGEALEPEVLRPWMERFGDEAPRIVNMYGITETTVHVTYRPILRGDLEEGHRSPVGVSISDLGMKVLDGALSLAPIGVPGELYVSGDGLARGYLNRSALTADRFVADPFDGRGGRLYRTGDLVRWNAQGELEYLGRIDHQVKIRGFRIELGEIEAKLLAQPEVREAVVVASEGPGGARLVAYVSLNRPVEVAELRERLGRELPEYMVPGLTMVLEALPLNANGKIDRKALPAPEASAEGGYEAPLGELEQALAAIWAGVLKVPVDTVGRHSNFFELGGDSILSLQVVTRVRGEGYVTTPRQLFERQTIAELASVVEICGESQSVDQGPAMGDVGLLPIQARFFELPIVVRHHYNQSILLASREPLLVDSLEAALAAVVQHHDSLRLRYQQDPEGTWRQYYVEATEINTESNLWRRQASDAKEIEAWCDEAQRSLDLEVGPLIRAVAIEMVDDSWRLLVAIHHLVVDGVSWRILLEDLQTAYGQHREGTPIELHAKTSSYQAWSAALQGYALTHEAEVEYWRSFADLPYQVPIDDLNDSDVSGGQETVALVLNESTTQALLKDAPASYRTQINDILLTALGRALSSWSGHDEFVIGLEGHGREDLFEGMDLTRTVGWFTSLFPVVLDARGELGEALKRVKENLRSIPNRGVGYGALRYMGSQAQRSKLAEVPTPEVVFNYLGQFDGSFDDKTLWTPATESRGAEQDKQIEQVEAFSINGQVYGGQLRLTLSYSAARYRDERAQALMAAFELELKALVAHCTSGALGVSPSDFPLAKVTQQELDQLPMPLENLEDIYPLSSMQSGMLFHSIYDESDAVTYVNQLRVDVEGLDVGRFRHAWKAVIARQDILRTGFLTEGGSSLQWVARDVTVPLIELDWRGREDLSKALNELSDQERERGFNLASPPLMRLVLVRTGEKIHHFLWSTHHLLLDGWSTGQLIGEVLHHYHTGHAAVSAPARYRDYIEWLQSRGNDGIRYWDNLLLGLDEPTRLIDSLVTQREPEVGYRSYPRSLSEAMTARVLTYARSQRLTINTVIQAAWALLLNAYTGRSKVSFGATTSGRPADLPRAEVMVGLFINTVPVVVDCSPSQSIGEWLLALQQQLAASREHESTPLFDIQKSLGRERRVLFDTIVVFENYPVDESLREGSDDTVRFGTVQMQAGNHYPLTLRVNTTDRLQFDFLHERTVVSDALVMGMAEAYERLLCSLIEAPKASLLTALSWPSGWIGRVSPLSGATASVLALWSQSVLRMGSALAVSDESISLSFADLDARSDRVASVLRGCGVQAEVRVAVHANRSVDLVAALLGILKAGGVYVPLDPTLPTERLAYQVRDSGAALVLTTEPLAWDAGVPALVIDSLQAEDATFDVVEPHPSQAAYVIYTSGSTGVPKGVVVSHSALANYVLAVLERLDLPEDARSMAMVSTVAADLGHTVLFGALCSGRLLHLISVETAFDPDRFAAYMREHEVDVLKIVPSHLQALMSAGAPADVLPAKRLVVGGEASSWELFDRVRDLKPECRVLNHYGPAETTVGVLTQDAEVANRQATSLPVGRPVAGGEVYVLDSWLRAVPQGVAGELYIGGAGLARGYEDRVAQTAERFVANPYGEAGARLYRTGDRVRMLDDGSLEFLGRLDDQVKIRGYRVELREVAQVLSQQAGVAEAEVIAREGENGQPRLIGYVVPEAGVALDVQQIKSGLAQRLPDYMVPAAIMALDALPLTANGKVDRKALPEPGQQHGRHHEAPQGEVEEALASVWAEVLRRDRVGRNDNFFEIGGDSILSLQIVARTRKRGYRITPKQLMEGQTVAALAAHAVPLKTAEPPVAVEDAVNEWFALTPVQRWFFEQEFDEPHHWNMSVMLAATDSVDSSHVRQAVTQLVKQHSALRLKFELQGNDWRQSYKPIEESFFYEMHDLCHESDVNSAISRIADTAQRSLTLEQPFKVVWIEHGAKTGRLLLVAHHLLVDAVSWRILLDELETTYRRLSQGQALEQEVSTTTFKQWSDTLARYVERENLQSELLYWEASVGNVEPTLPGRQDRANTIDDLCSESFRLDMALTNKLLNEVPAAYRTQINDLLLAALALTLCKWGARESVLVELEGHGREDLFDGVDLTRTVGWFTTLFPVRLRPGDSGVAAAIKAVKEQLREVPNKGLGYGALRYLSKVGRSLNDRPYPQVTFNYLGQIDQSFNDNSLWGLAKESAGLERSGASHRRTWFTVNALVHEGKLGVTWNYSKEIHTHEEVAHLLDSYRSNLELLIAHCTSGAVGVTPSDFPLTRVGQLELDRLPMNPEELQDLYPLSPMQSGMLFHSVYDEGGTAYVNQLRVDVGGLDAARFRSAWQMVLARHDILRTGFLAEGDMPLQWVAKDVSVPMVEYDWRGEGHQSEELNGLAETELQSGFDLARPPLMRLALVRTEERGHHLIWTRHHLLMDGWSTSRLLGEVMTAYAGDTLLGTTGRYRDYIGWLQGKDNGASQTYWKGLISQLDEPTRLVGAFGESDTRNGYASHVAELGPEDTARLEAFARAERVTVNTVIQAVWGYQLSRYTGQRTVAFGATVAGRPAELPGVEEMLGLFINTMPVVSTLAAGQRVGDWLRELQAQNVASREHEHVPLYEIQRWAGQGGQALFDTIVVFENYPVGEVLREAESRELTFDGLHNRVETNYPLTLTAHLGNVLRLSYSYVLGSLSDDMVRRVADQTVGILLQLPAIGSRTVGEIELVLDEERERLTRWGVNVEGQSDAALVHQLVEAQALARPQATALVFGEEELNYAELNDRANRLAHHLIKLGVGPEVRVGVALERSVELVVSLLAILKAGGAYVPLDLDYPAERLSYVVEDSGIGLLMTYSDQRTNMPAVESVRVLYIDELDLVDEPASNPDAVVRVGNLAYVIYTSGSTGQPKGVEVAHGALSEHFLAIAKVNGLCAEDRVLQFATFAFDAAQAQWLLPLATGAAVVLRKRDELTMDALEARIRSAGVTIVHLPPAYLRQLVQHLSGRRLPLKLCIAGGEAWSVEDYQAAREVFEPQRMINSYGPTEAVITPAMWAGNETFPRGHSYIPIGHPVGARKAYVFDRDLNLVSPKVSGELYIGGTVLARGYLNRPAMTADRFVADPFDDRGGRLYRTGDLVRWNAQGELEYLGRIDHQVKIRGFRIELGEIEAKLLAQSEVREAVVVASEGPVGARLVAYVSLNRPVEVTELRERLGRELPEYMVPGLTMVLEALPLNANGKIDRKALPAPEASAEGGYEAPVGELEEALAAVWADVLKVPIETVGRHSNFFELGGDSILSLQVISRAKATGLLGLEDLQLRQLMLGPTIALLLGVDDDSSGSLVSLNGTNTADVVPLFCVHPGLGGVFDYRPLAMRLEGVRRVYGLACPMLNDLSRDYESLVALADDYVNWIVRKQEHGPYYIFGWSLGGLLAALIAARLEKNGKEVGFLGLCDSSIPGISDHFADGNPERGWKEDFKAQFRFVVPGFDIQENLSDVDNPENVDTISGLIDDYIEKGEKSGKARNEAYATIGSEDLARMFIVGRRLSRLLARTPSLSKLRIAPHYWWARGTPTEAKHRLGEQLGNGAAVMGPVIPAEHADIVCNAALLNDVVSSLAGLNGGGGGSQLK